MSQTVPTTEPSRFRAGDTLTWRRALANYPASTYALAYRLINAAGSLDIAASADGDEHRVSVPAETTAGWAPGTYTWQAFVTAGSERYTVGTGQMVILPDLAAQTAGFDARSTAQKALDDTRAAMATWIASNGHVQEYEIAGRHMKYASLADIEGRIRLLQKEVAREKAAERLAAGLSTGRRVLVRF